MPRRSRPRSPAVRPLSSGSPASLQAATAAYAAARAVELPVEIALVRLLVLAEFLPVRERAAGAPYVPVYGLHIRSGLMSAERFLRMKEPDPEIPDQVLV